MGAVPAAKTVDRERSGLLEDLVADLVTHSAFPNRPDLSTWRVTLEQWAIMCAELTYDLKHRTAQSSDIRILEYCANNDDAIVIGSFYHSPEPEQPRDSQKDIEAIQTVIADYNDQFSRLYENSVDDIGRYYHVAAHARLLRRQSMERALHALDPAKWPQPIQPQIGSYRLYMTDVVRWFRASRYLGCEKWLQDHWAGRYGADMMSPAEAQPAAREGLVVGYANMAAGLRENNESRKKEAEHRNKKIAERFNELYTQHTNLGKMDLYRMTSESLINDGWSLGVSIDTVRKAVSKFWRPPNQL